MPVNKKRDPFAPKENSPIIIKDSYEVGESEVSYSIPISDKDGAILYYQECTEEEYLIWYGLIEDSNE